MLSITANDLKIRGVAAIEATLAHHPKAVITVRGKDRFVVIEMAHYHYLRECELDAALAQTLAEVTAGRHVVESAHQHMARLEGLLAAGAAAAAAKVEKSVAGTVPAKKRGARKQTASRRGNR